MTLDWLLSLCAWLVLPCLAWFARRTQGAWLAPGAITALAWTAAAGIPLFLATDLPVHPRAYAFVLAVVGVCVVASTLGASVELGPRAQRRQTTDVRPWQETSWRIYWVCVALGCAAPVLLYGHATDHTRADSLSQLAMYASMGRYEGDYSVPMSVRLFTAITYFAAAVSAFITASTPAEARKWRRSLAWVIPLVANVLVHTEKANIFYAMVLWGSGWAAGLALLNSQVRRPYGALILKLAGAILLVMAFLVTAQSMRMNRMTMADIPYVLEHLRIYVVGHMPVFGDWLTHNFDANAVDGYGAHTFAGVAEALGLGERIGGIYEGTAKFTEANIFTAFRPLLEDFGFVGGLGFMFALAYAAGVGWRLLQAGTLTGAPLVVVYTGYILSSPITPIFVYSTLVGVLVVFTMWSSWADGNRRQHDRVVRAAAPAIRKTLMTVASVSGDRT